MDRCGQISGRSGEVAADSPTNQLQLKSDAHWLWDSVQYCIVPREDVNNNADSISRFTHTLNDGEELHTDWHNKKLQPLPGHATEYLFARFAWSLFPKLHAFLQTGASRHLAVRQAADGEVSERMYSSTGCREFTIGQGKGRSAESTSPTTRARSNDHSGAVGTQAGLDRSLSPTRSNFHSPDSGIAVLDDAIAHKADSYQTIDLAKAQSDEAWLGYVRQGLDREEGRGRERQRRLI